MPEYFEGATEIYYNNVDVKDWRFKNKYKFPVSEEVKNIVRANFTMEIDFYEYLKQRLQNQYEEISQITLK